MYYTNNNSILDWYDINKRNLPWRLTKDPYKIWLSEVMLQQTQVSTVIPYYENWIRKFPTVNSVAKVNIDESKSSDTILNIFIKTLGFTYLNPHVYSDTVFILGNFKL